MAKYQDKFTLSPDDIDVIERALRAERSKHAGGGAEFILDSTTRQQIRVVDQLLGKIHNQKIFYSQVKVVGIPSG